MGTMLIKGVIILLYFYETALMRRKQKAGGTRIALPERGGIKHPEAFPVHRLAF
jgi:hypothetical protein